MLEVTFASPNASSTDLFTAIRGATSNDIGIIDVHVDAVQVAKI